MQAVVGDRNRIRLCAGLFRDRPNYSHGSAAKKKGIARRESPKFGKNSHRRFKHSRSGKSKHIPFLVWSLYVEEGVLKTYSMQQGGVENVQYATTIKERGEEAHMRSPVQGLPQ